MSAGVGTAAGPGLLETGWGACLHAQKEALSFEVEVSHPFLWRRQPREMRGAAAWGFGWSGDCMSECTGELVMNAGRGYAVASSV